MEWGTEILRVFWLSWPVLVAAAVQIAVIKLKLLEGLKRPLDGGRTVRGKRLFGDHKTWRGAIVYVVVSMLAVIPQAVWPQPNLQYFDYTKTFLPYALDVGFLLGLGFVVGELPNSFLKRQQAIPPGERGRWWNVLLDQVDSLVGCLLFLLPLWVAPLKVWLLVLVICSGLHIAFNAVFVLLGLKTSVF
ncbi:MAG: CDP-archaeol synthase [Planctomycetota bacterium]